ncbi:MAG: hypothetical protein ACE5GX_05570 [Thermoanaerobaculia bacterium]
MRKPSSGRALRTLVAALLAGVVAVFSACRKPSDERPPLLVVSGPDDFVSFEVRNANGETIWRLEADDPTPVAAFAYGVVPDGFRRVVPPERQPRPLAPGEDLLMESTTRDRIFLHRGYADSEVSAVVLEWGMRRREPDSARSTE